MSDGLREALTALVKTHGGPDGYVMTYVLRNLLDRHPQTDGGAPAPGGSSTPVAAGPTSEATPTAAPSSPDHTHGGADHGTRYLVVEIPPAASEADADAITDLVANHVYAYEPVGENKAWDPFIHGWRWPDEVPHPVARPAAAEHVPAPVPFVARNIVNQLADLWEVPVDRRQATNDAADQFVTALISRVLSRDAVAEVLRREVSGWPVDAGLPFLPDREWDEALARAVVALARSEQEVREQIAEAIEGIAEFCKDYYAETGEVLIPRDVAARIARGER